MKVEGQDSGEGTSAHAAMLNKQRQFLPHIPGSYSELFDFPIHYVLCMQPPVGLAGSICKATSFDFNRVSVEEEIQSGPGTH